MDASCSCRSTRLVSPRPQRLKVTRDLAYMNITDGAVLEGNSALAGGRGGALLLSLEQSNVGPFHVGGGAVLRGNKASGEGGALAVLFYTNDGVVDSVVFSDGVVAEDNASGASGGVLSFSAPSLPGGVSVRNGVRMSGNAAGAHGLALSPQGDGGAISMELDTDPLSVFELSNATFSNNTASSSDGGAAHGGAIALRVRVVVAQLRVTNGSLLSNNSAALIGGAIAIFNNKDNANDVAGTCRVVVEEGARAVGNKAATGGFLGVLGSQNGNVTIAVVLSGGRAGRVYRQSARAALGTGCVADVARAAWLTWHAPRLSRLRRDGGGQHGCHERGRRVCDRAVLLHGAGECSTAYEQHGHPDQRRRRLHSGEPTLRRCSFCLRARVPRFR
jgi:hypothetical protein